MHSWDSNPRTLGWESYPITPRPERAPALQQKSLIALFSSPPWLEFRNCRCWHFVDTTLLALVVVVLAGIEKRTSSNTLCCKQTTTRTRLTTATIPGNSYLMQHYYNERVNRRFFLKWKELPTTCLFACKITSPFYKKQVVRNIIFKFFKMSHSRPLFRVFSVC